jgi:hypothetical protein
MANNKTLKNRGGSIFGKTKIDKYGNVSLVVSNKNKLSNSVDVFQRRNDLIKKYQEIPNTNNFYEIPERRNEIILKNKVLRSTEFQYYKSIVYMDQHNKILFPKNFSKVMSSSKTQVYEVEIFFNITQFIPGGFFKNSSYSIHINCLRKIREIKIDRGYIYHGIEMDSVMSYDSWERFEKKESIDNNTFWFNLFPISEKHVSLILIESNLMNPDQYSKDKNEKQFNQKVNEFVDVLINFEPSEETGIKEE